MMGQQRVDEQQFTTVLLKALFLCNLFFPIALTIFLIITVFLITFIFVANFLNLKDIFLLSKQLDNLKTNKQNLGLR